MDLGNRLIINKTLLYLVPFLLFTLIIFGGASVSDEGTSEDEESFLSKYGSYFRTKEEEAEIKKKLKKISTKTSTTIKHEEVCVINTFTAKINFIKMFSRKETCKETTTVTTVAVGGKREHGCCISEPFDTGPYNALDMDLRTVRLYVHDGKRQYFQTETCERTAVTCPQHGCPDCQCGLQLNKFKALIYDSKGGPKETLVLIPGGCKCEN